MLTKLPVKSVVLLPYKFTLLSNDRRSIIFNILVLLPYKFTLLSNIKQINQTSD